MWIFVLHFILTVITTFLDFINSCYDLNKYLFQGHILTVAGVTAAICASPFIAASNLVALAVWPTWIAVAVTETIRKVSIGLLYLAFIAITVVFSTIKCWYEKTHFKR